MYLDDIADKPLNNLNHFLTTIMITTLSTVFYVISLSEDKNSKYTIQKGQAISRNNNDGNFLVYNFSQSEDATDFLPLQPLRQESIYQVIGKFTISQDASINITITTNIPLSLSEENIPISKPIISLVGHISAEASLTESTYHLPLLVKPYISADSYNPITITLVHPSDGRLKNSFTSAKKSSLIHCIGVLIIVDHTMYCETLEFQFISSKSTTSTPSTVTPPWKIKQENDSTSAKKTIENQVAVLHKTISQSPPEPRLNEQKISTTAKRVKVFKVADIAKSLLTKTSAVSGAGGSEDQTSNEDDAHPPSTPSEPPAKRTRKKYNKTI